MNKLFLFLFFNLLVLFPSCKPKSKNTSQASINLMELKRGEIISCGPLDQQFGSLEFTTSCSEDVRGDFNLAVKLLHSFEYDEAEKAFASVIDRQPDCAMAYWGVAMSNFHPLWAPPSEAELIKGTQAIAIAESLKTSKRETAYISAIASFYTGWDSLDHRSRCLNFEEAMEKIHENYPDDKEAAVLYALALCAAADPADKTFERQKKAGNLLKTLYPAEPDHPGIVHYIIHAYDYPELAREGLEAARKYAAIAPSSAHALHMPSHIFTRLGLWDECIQSNAASVHSARCYAQAAGIKGHWDEELHGLDYLVYAYLQKGDNDSAIHQWDYLKTISEVSPVNFKVAYAFAAIPSRVLFENRRWHEAAELKPVPANFPWQKFPWQEAIFHFTRLMGAVNINNISTAKEALNELYRIHDTLLNKREVYSANQVSIQIKTGEAWLALKAGSLNDAHKLMQLAADMEDKTEKHPVTPGEVIPAKELLGDMLLQMNKPGEALKAYEENLQKHPNRFNAVFGAAMAAKRSGNIQKAKTYFQQLVNVVGTTQTKRPEMKVARLFLESR